MHYADRVQETTTTTGTGTLTLAGAVSAYRAFSAAFSNGDTVRYAIVFGTAWEVGEGVYSAGTLTRATVFASSNANALVSFAAGTKNVWSDVPAAALKNLGSLAANTALIRDSSGNVGGATDVLMGSSYVSFGTNPAASGFVRAPNATPIVTARDVANGADLCVVASDASNYLYLGDPAGSYAALQAGGQDFIVTHTGTGIVFRIGATQAVFSLPINVQSQVDPINAYTTDLCTVVKSLTSNFTVTSTTPSASNLSFPIAAGETWDIDASGLMSSGASTNGMRFSIQGPAGCTLSGYVDGCTTNATTRPIAGLTAINTVAPQTYCGIASTTLTWAAKVSVTCGVTGGTVAIGLATATGSVAMSILASSRMVARRAIKV